jgi:hypothetical protein
MNSHPTVLFEKTMGRDWIRTPDHHSTQNVLLRFRNKYAHGEGDGER